jgi:hypothetical protein
MFRWSILIRLLCTVTAVIGGSLAQSARSEVVALDGTSLRVALAQGWQTGPVSPGGLRPTGLRYKGNPAFEITSGQTTEKSPTNNLLGLPHECDFMFGALQSMNNGTIGSLSQRPEYIPQEYYAQILVAKPAEDHAAIFACLFLGGSNIVIEIRPAPTQTSGEKLTGMLQSIADSAKRSSTLLYAPGQLQLPILELTVSLSRGIWGVGKTTNPSIGPVDLLVRTGGVSELKVMPVIIGGRCSDAINSTMQMKNPVDSSISPKLKKDPPFVSSSWEPAAIEMDLHHESADRILITVCRQLPKSKILLVNLSYGSGEVPLSDAPLVAEVLDELAAAVSNTHR